MLKWGMRAVVVLGYVAEVRGVRGLVRGSVGIGPTAPLGHVDIRSDLQHFRRFFVLRQFASGCLGLVIYLNPSSCAIDYVEGSCWWC